MRSAALAFALSAAFGLSARRAAGQGAIPPAPQRPRYAAGLVAGASQFDLSGTGWAALAGARLEAELRRWLVAEGAFGVFRPAEQFGERSTYAVPEVQLQLQLPGRTLRPYLGAGAGRVFGGGESRGTVSGAGGVRVAFPGARVDARGELRVRGVSPAFAGSTAEWTLGAGYRF